MQPGGREMHGIGGTDGGASNDDFFTQMLSTLPSAWPEIGTGKSPWEQLGGASGEDALTADGLQCSPYDESALLANRLRNHRIGGGSSSAGEKPVMLPLRELHQQGSSHHSLLLSPTGRSPTDAGDAGFVPLPLFVDRSRGDDLDGPFKSPNATGDDSLYNGFGNAIHSATQLAAQQTFVQGSSLPSQSYGGNGVPAASGGAAAPAPGTSSGGAAPPRQQRVRARRGQATDPHSIAERHRRERIAERMKALQELVPNANKTDKASMLDEIIDYVKFLQLQVKVLSMSRLGGAAAVAPLVATMSSEHSSISNGNGGGTSSSNGGNNGSGGGTAAGDSMQVTEQQVARLMEQDMGSAMQYLQGKGLCLMPISLASAISSTTTCLPPHPSSSAAATAAAIRHLSSLANGTASSSAAATGDNHHVDPSN